MNLRREQLMSQENPFDHNFAIREQEPAWCFDVIRSIDDIPGISVSDEDYAVRSMLSMDTSTHAHLDQSLTPAAVGERMDDLGADHEEAFASDVESSAGIVNVTPAGQELHLQQML
jgi:hypothetical protein